MHIAFTSNSKQSIVIHPITTTHLPEWLSEQPEHMQQWVKLSQFNAESGTSCLIPDNNGQLQCILLGITDENDYLAFGALPVKIPEGCYVIADNVHIKTADQYQLASLGWGLGFYQFAKYKKSLPRAAQLLLHPTVNEKLLTDTLDAIYFSRDLINTPAEDMGPEQLENAARTVAKKCGAKISVIKGEHLIKENYPAVYAVGRASPRDPRVIDLRWNSKKNAPTITLVGKGVCFDTGGLDLKTSAGMLLMKKDMAGAAMMLGLAQLIMSQQLPVNLRVLIGAVDNAVSGNSYRPGDIVATRSGKTVEITNTDAEGRMVLCDLLFEACSESPDVVIDFATLTGAGRVALGEDIPAFYAQPQSFADELMQSSRTVSDPIWQLPLVQNYREKLKSDIADMVNAVESPYGGSITAALFLQSFVNKDTTWAHFDTAAWNFKPKPGRPAGGEVFGIRAVFEWLQKKFA